jgi:hypothetical protein
MSLAVRGLRRMFEVISIQNFRYFKPFDNTDNPCCWQLDLVCKDVEAALDSFAIEYDSIYEDWGTAYSWTNSEGVGHSITVSCVDVDAAIYEFRCDFFRKKWFGLKTVLNAEPSDFGRIRSALLALSQEE